MLNIYTVSFFGHRKIEKALAVEERLEAFVCRLLAEKEYVEFLVGRDSLTLTFAAERAGGCEHIQIAAV